MATQVIKNRPFWLGSYKMSDFSQAVAIDYGADAVDDTILGDTTRSNAGGLKTFGFSADAFADFGASGPDAQIFTNISGSVPLTLASVDGTAQETGFLINTLQTQTTPVAGTVGDMAGVNLAGNAKGSLVRGTLEVNTSTSSSGNSTGIQEGAVSAAQSMYASLHVTAAAGTTLDVIIQSDDNGSFTSATNRITFTQATAITSEYLSVAGAIADDYWRANYTISGGSFTFAVCFGIL